MFQDPVKYNSIAKGGLRLLTLGEINLASSLYGFSIHYNQVWIHLDSYLPFNLQPNNIGMSPNGEMWFREGTYENDFSETDIVKKKHLFLHEMMHVWQHQRGMWVRMRGLVSRIADYSYSFDKANLLDYSLEQQASIVSDYWLLKHYGSYNYTYLIEYRDYDVSEPENILRIKYEKILGNFPS